MAAWTEKQVRDIDTLVTLLHDALVNHDVVNAVEENLGNLAQVIGRTRTLRNMHLFDTVIEGRYLIRELRRCVERIADAAPDPELEF